MLLSSPWLVFSTHSVCGESMSALKHLPNYVMQASGGLLQKHQQNMKGQGKGSACYSRKQEMYQLHAMKRWEGGNGRRPQLDEFHPPPQTCMMLFSTFLCSMVTSHTFWCSLITLNPGDFMWWPQQPSQSLFPVGNRAVQRPYLWLTKHVGSIFQFYAKSYNSLCHLRLSVRQTWTWNIPPALFTLPILLRTSSVKTLQRIVRVYN